MNRWDFYTGLLFLIFAGAIAAAILQAPAVQEATGPGPYFFPAISALLIGGLAAALLIRSLRQPGAPQPEKPGATSKTRHRIIWIVLWCFIYAAAIERLGYILSTALTTFALLAYFTWRAWIFNVIAAIVTPGLIYFLFDSLLKIHMPKGPWGF